MPAIRWKSTKTWATILVIYAIYLIIKIRKYEHKTVVFLPNTEASEAWEFVADFSNMKYLNPTLINFNILDESGNYDHWKYTVEYFERLSHWPYLPNNAIGHFNITTNKEKDIFYIKSVHKTCMFMDLFCLDTFSEFKFNEQHSGKGCVCEEYVLYECPTLLSAFCRREVNYQRAEIMENLKKYFLKFV